MQRPAGNSQHELGWKSEDTGRRRRSSGSPRRRSRPAVASPAARRITFSRAVGTCPMPRHGF